MSGKSTGWTCRMCHSAFKDKSMSALHQNLCTGGRLSIFLSNVNNFERPGRERCSKHHRYRPSSDRALRRRSIQPESPHAAKMAPATWRQRGRAANVPPAAKSRGGRRSKSIPPPRRRAPSGSRQRSRSVSRRSFTPTRTPGSRAGFGGRSRVSTVDGEQSGDKNGGQDGDQGGEQDGDQDGDQDGGRWSSTWEGGLSPGGKSTAESERDVVSPAPSRRRSGCGSCSQSGYTTDRDQCPARVEGATAKSNHMKSMRCAMENFKPYFFNSDSMPSSLEVSRRRFRGGRRGYFCCQIGCSCRKCHYFSLLLTSGRQSSFLRRCDADCPCSKCHLPDLDKSNALLESPSGRKSLREASTPGDRARPSPLSSPARAPPRSPRSVPGSRRGRGRRDSIVESQNATVSDVPESVRASKRKATDDKSEASETERDSLSPKRRRERKELHYVCKPCGKELNAWCVIRKHLLSSEHLQAASEDRREEGTWQRKRRRGRSPFDREEWECPTRRSTKESLMAGLGLVHVDGDEEPLPAAPPEAASAADASGEASAAGDDTWPAACDPPTQPEVTKAEASGTDECVGNVPEVPATSVASGEYHNSLRGHPNGLGNIAGVSQEVIARTNPAPVLSPHKLILRNCLQPSENHTSKGQTSTFVRIDYNKKMVVTADVGLKDPSPGTGNGSSSFECARINGSVYNCVRVKNENELPQPFVDMGSRCDLGNRENGVGSALVGTVSGVENRPTSRRWPMLNHTRSRSAPYCGVPQGRRVNGGMPKTETKMIRRDYSRKMSLERSRKCSPTVGSLTYIGPSELEEEICLSPSPPIQGLVDEEALGERLYLSDSEEEAMGRGLPSMDIGEQVVVLDSQRFLSLLVQRLNDGGLCCNFCGNNIDGNCVLSQLYNFIGRPHVPDNHPR